jgi:RNA recognition motif-containing protein
MFIIAINSLHFFFRYGEVANINLVRDKVTGKSKGFCFLCYEDQRSTILAVDNLNSIKVIKQFFFWVVSHFIITKYVF